MSACTYLDERESSAWLHWFRLFGLLILNVCLKALVNKHFMFFLQLKQGTAGNCYVHSLIGWHLCKEKLVFSLFTSVIQILITVYQLLILAHTTYICCCVGDKSCPKENRFAINFDNKTPVQFSCINLKSDRQMDRWTDNFVLINHSKSMWRTFASYFVAVGPTITVPTSPLCQRHLSGLNMQAVWVGISRLTALKKNWGRHFVSLSPAQRAI